MWKFWIHIKPRQRIKQINSQNDFVYINFLLYTRDKKKFQNQHNHIEMHGKNTIRRVEKNI